jgi:hypothetical protein
MGLIQPCVTLAAVSFMDMVLIILVQSAVMAGLKVVSIKSLADGSLDLADLEEKAEKHRSNLAAFMVCRVFPSLGPCFSKFLLYVCRSHILLRSESSRMVLRKWVALPHPPATS